MVRISTFVGVASLLSGMVLAAPMPDSAINEPGVRAPDGVKITDGTPAATMACGSSGCGSSETTTMMESGCGSSGCDKQMTTSTSTSMMMETTSMMKESGCGSGGCDSKQMTTSMMDSGCGSSGCGKEMTTSMKDSGCGSGGCGMQTSSTMMMETTSTMTTEAAKSTYGSGSSNWGGSGYNDCVNQCMASFAPPAGTYMPTATTGSDGSKGTGATHTVIVAPTQGVLRYVPFALNASVGDTIAFMWNANNHTVTKSSELLPCNKSSDAPVFVSGTHDKGFMFTQVVNTTDPVFYYCGTPGHCPKGMFGIINPPNAFGAATSVSASMGGMVAKDSNMAAMAAVADVQTANNTMAARWGGNIDMAKMPDWSMPLVAQNVMYMRTLLAQNPEIMKDDGSIDLSSTGSTPLMIPADITSNLAAGSSPSSSASNAPTAPAGAAGSASSPSSSPSPSPSGKSNGALSSFASPRFAVGLVSVVATFFLL